MADTHIFLKCKIKDGHQSDSLTSLDKHKERLLEDVNSITKKMNYGRSITYNTGCAWEQHKYVLPLEYSRDKYKRYKEKLICDIKYLGLNKDMKVFAETIHAIVNSHVSDKGIFEKCDIIWGMRDIDKLYIDDLLKLQEADFYTFNKKGWKVYDVTCPSCDIPMAPIREGIYECPKCKKVMKYP